MRASAYVGRVGGLAVALGVGVAVTLGGQGVAWADDTGGDPGGGTTQKTTQTNPSSEQADADDAGLGNVGVKIRLSVRDSLRRALSGSLTKPGAQRSSTGNGRTGGAKDDGDTRDATEADAEVDDGAASTTRTRTSSRSSKSTAAESRSTTVRPVAATPDPATAVSRAVQEVDAPAAKVAATISSIPDRIAAAVTSVTVNTQAVKTVPAVKTAAPPQPAPAAPSRAVSPVVNRLLAVVGLSPLASGSPDAPAQPWALGALIALASRRETEQSASTSARTATPSGSASTAAVAAAAPYDPAKDYVVTPTPVSGNTDYIANVTGPDGLNDTQNRFGIGGTDVGIIWDNGIKDNPATAVNEHQVLIAFGDTFSQRYPVRTGVWRMNTLFRSTDTTLSNGMYIPDGIPHDPGMYSGTPESMPNFSREIIGNYHYGVGPEVTIIPTAAISVPGAGKNGATRQYVNFMAVKSWDTPGRWTTNYSAIAYSDDNGQNWTVVPRESVRSAGQGRTTTPFVNGNQNFQQFAYVKGAVVDANGVPIKDAATGQAKTDGYVYAYGTPAGRGGTAYLSRVKEAQILDQTKYEYWNGSSWVANNPAAAKPILPGTTTSSWFGLVKTTTYPTVGEMSVQYNAYEKKYVMLYADQNNNVVMRKADRPEGPWSAPTTLVTSAKMPGLYAPMVHPWSSTDNLSPSEQQYLYWNLSTWDDYQVKLMRTDLSKV